jgi:PAS domain S-box-containing protein
MREHTSTPTSEGDSPSIRPASGADDQWLLGSALAGKDDRRWAAAMAGLLLVAFLATAPFADRPIPFMHSIAPTYDAAVIILNLITALLLYTQYRELGHPAFLALSCGFLFTTPIIAAHGVSAPDALLPGYLIGDSQTAPWFWMIWHGLFPVSVIAYALSLRAGPFYADAAHRRWPVWRARACVIATLAISCVIIAAILGGERLLPPLMADKVHVLPATKAIAGIGWLIHLSSLVLLVLATRLRRTLDLWLAVMLLANLIDVALSALMVDGRNQLGFYAGRLYGLLGSICVLAVLIRRSVGLQAELIRTADALRASDARFRKILEIETVGVVIFDRMGGVTGANKAFLNMVGFTRDELDHGEIRYDQLTPTEWRWRDKQTLADLAERGATAPFEKEYLRKDGSKIWILCAPKLLDANQAVEFVLDVTARRRAEERQRLSEHHLQRLFAELQHRVRNTLAIVRSIARRTAESSQTIEELDMHLQGRLAAFSRVQALVTRNPDHGVDLTGLVEEELRAHAAREGNGLVIEGPEVELTPRAAETISLAIHELATNAVKYGALSSANGTLSIGWERSAENGSEWLYFRWQEGGLDRPLEDSGERGFGFELLERRLPYDLRATTELEFAREGLRFAMRMPLGSDVLAS